MEVIEKNELVVMDKTGDTKTIWDPRDEDEVDPKAEKMIAVPPMFTKERHS